MAALSAWSLVAFYLQFRYPTQRWYYLPLVTIVAVASEAAIATMRNRMVGIARACVALAILALASTHAWSSLKTPQTNMDVVAAEVSRQARPDDLVLISPWYYAVSFARYYTGSADATSVPPLKDLRVHRYDLLKKAMQETDALAPLRDRVQRVLASGGRVFLVGALAAPPPGVGITINGPPPLLTTRWNSAPYEEQWVLEMGRFLANNALDGHLIPVKEPEGPLELPRLAVFQGWRY